MFHVAAQAYALRRRADKNRLTSTNSAHLRVSPRESFEKLYSVSDTDLGFDDIDETVFAEQDIIVRLKIVEFNDKCEEEDADKKKDGRNKEEVGYEV